MSEWLAVLADRRQSAGEEEAAVGLYREALDSDGENAWNWLYLAAAYEKLGRREEATRTYEKAAALAPDEAGFRAALEALRGPAGDR